MLAILLALGLHFFHPAYLEERNGIERVCFYDGYFITNWRAAPISVRELNVSTKQVEAKYLLNPLDRTLRKGNPFVRVHYDESFYTDFGRCR